MVITRKTLLLFSFVCFLSEQIIAQSANATFRNITSADGLPSTSVADITQDAFGFIWIGTWDGDYRYDGLLFKKTPGTFGGRYIKADKKGGIWISFEHSVGYYDPYVDNVRKYNTPNTDRYPDIGLDNSGGVWVATNDGMLKFDQATSQFRKETVLQSGSIRGLTADGDGELLFLYQDKNSKQLSIGHRTAKGAYTFEPLPADENNPDKKKPPNYKLETTTPNLGYWSAFIRRIDSAGILIINKYGWAYKTNKEANWIFKTPLNRNLSLAATDVRLDGNGNFWLIQENALTKINIITAESTVYSHDPKNPNSVLSLGSAVAGSKIFFDREGILWVASFSREISRLNLFENDFGLLKDSTGEPIQDGLSALESKDGSYWIGSRTRENGLIHYSADGKIMKRYGSKSPDSPPGKTVSTDLSHPYPWALAESADGSVWVGGGSPGPHRGGVSRIRPGSDQITRFKNDSADTSSLIGDRIDKILVDGSDRVWVFTNNGFCYINPATEKITRAKDILISAKEKNTNYDPELITVTGDLLITNSDNFKHFIIDHNTLTVKPFADDITLVDSMMLVHQDDAGKIWFVSPKSFGYLDSSFKAIGDIYEFDKLGLPIEEEPQMFNSDKQGNIWMATDNGIIEFDPATKRFRHFGFERGLQGNRFDFLNYKGKSGKIYFGGTGGVNIFEPAAIKANPYPPEMVFTNLKLDGKSITPGKKSAIQKPIFAADKITVEPGVLTVSIDFAAIHFAGNNDNRFQYKLQGFDNNWRDGGIIGNATYTNLSPGVYTLYIKGSNWDGVWSDGKKSIKLIILPPWWRTWWAFIFYALLFFFLLWQFFRYQKIRTIRKERERTQQRELEQAKEIEKAYHELRTTQAQLIQSEKMASLGELTAGIAHEIQNPLNFVNNFSEVNTELIDELQTELKAGNTEDVFTISNDIKYNEQKILHHGKRADAIVKGMLQHSRASSGKKEPTDINALADEYLRLSYHGMRAKDKNFNVEIKTDFDESIGKINIVPQDIGRALLNLFNNAFYTVMQKNASTNVAGQPYEPIVSVCTKRVDNKIEIYVKDNGVGIPQKVVDKIFQPFFTTKPTGQGTGLGLSLAYDIIKVHGGEIKVETKEGESTTFIIQL